ncbi:MAG: hypothetical protein L0211_06135 [Planctomycetaceae bacterium]|nr:hypothetical protein [Planctomycetaceae bacterium]
MSWRGLTAAEPEIRIDTPMPPPGWALLERELLRANAAACREFFDKYFDERGFLLCVERWGGDDGPDDAIENCNDWPLLYALGGSDQVRRMYERAWEGHLRQYTLAKTTDVPLARDGMFYKEFHTQFDWMHLGEELTVFNVMGLGGLDAANQQRVRRFAGLYMNEDPQAPNYDPQHKIIRSMFNGSRGPLLRKATALDWAGDPIEVEHRFKPGHGERTYQEMLDHFRDYTDIVGDLPQNLRATTLAFNAFALTGDEKYKRWILEYVDAWCERAAANGGIMPSNVGLDGQIGSATGGKWYGGTYGWGFSVKVPQTGEIAHRNRTMYGFAGLANAYLLTGDDRYLATWRKQMDAINAQRRRQGDRWMYPRMYGDQGWYDWHPQPYAENALELYALSLRPDDRVRVPASGWLDFLSGTRPDYPESALQRDLARIRQRVAAMREDPTTPDTRLADDPMKFNPCSVASLLELTLGGVHPGVGGNVLIAQLRYFDPQRRRAGLPEDVAALVERLTADETTVMLVNVNQIEPRTVVMQGGAYGEHKIAAVKIGDKETAIGQRAVKIALAPGAGAKLTLQMRRFRDPPTLDAP